MTQQTGRTPPIATSHPPRAIGVSSRARRALPRGQQGIALVVALILLVVITIVGVAAVSGTLMQNKMASNQHDREVAFQSAESTLRQARTWLLTNEDDVSIRDCTQGNEPCLPNPFTDPNSVNGAIHAADVVGDLATASPQYVVEKVAIGGGGAGAGCSSANAKQRNAEFNGACLSTNEPAKFYRITARSGNPSLVANRAIVTLQSVIRVK